MLNFYFSECSDRCLTCSNDYYCDTCVDNAHYNAESGCDCNDGFDFVSEGYNMCIDEFACSDDILSKTQQ